MISFKLLTTLTLTGSELAILACIESYDQEGCPLSREQMSSQLGISIHRLKLILPKLRSMGLIHFSRVNGTQRVFTIPDQDLKDAINEYRQKTRSSDKDLSEDRKLD